MTEPNPGVTGYMPRPGTPLVTQADRWQWQRRAVRALAAILDAHAELPAITWTLTAAGGLAGQVNGIGVPPEEARETFTAWRQALRLDSVKEAPIRDTGVISLSGHGYHGTVRIGLIAHVYHPLPDDAAPAVEASPVKDPEQGARVHPARGSRDAATDNRATAPATRPGRLQAGPLIPPRQPPGPQPTHTR
jgi:hypothetical protein